MIPDYRAEYKNKTIFSVVSFSSDWNKRIPKKSSDLQFKKSVKDFIFNYTEWHYVHQNCTT